MKIYAHPFSAPSRLAVIVAKLLGLEYQYENVDLFKQAQLGPEFTNVNTKQKVPVLEDDGVVITESVSIMKYLCEKNGNTDLYPSSVTSPKDRAIVDMHLSILADLRNNGQRYLLGSVVLPKMGKSMPEAIVKQAKAELDKHLAEQEADLASNPDKEYAILDRLTLVDVYLFILSLPMTHLLFKEEFQTKFPHWYKLVQGLKEKNPIFAQDEKEYVDFLKLTPFA
eukprot:403331112